MEHVSGIGEHERPRSRDQPKEEPTPGRDVDTGRTAFAQIDESPAQRESDMRRKDLLIDEQRLFEGRRAGPAQSGTGVLDLQTFTGAAGGTPQARWSV